MATTQRHYSSGCKISFFHYTNENPKEDAPLSEVMQCEKIDFLSTDVDCPIISFNYTKTNNTASGFFQIVLLPTDNWMKRLRPGDWLTVYLTNGRQGYHLRCLGNIDCVTMSESINPETGARSVKYVITGQDYGKVFEKYWIYIHPFLSDAITTSLMIPQILNTITGTAGQLIILLLNVFLGAASNGQSFFKLPSYLQQWLIPTELAQELSTQGVVDAFNSNRPPNFYDILNKDKVQTNLPGEVVIYLLDVNNSLWGIMKGNSNPYINELFCEMDKDNKPAIYYRTIPFAFQNYEADSRVADTLTRFKDLEAARISGGEILNSSINVNEQVRFNFTLLNSTQVNSGSNDPKASISLLAGKYPYINAASCHRYGTLVYEGTSNQLLVNKNKWDPELLLSWNDLIKHWMKDNAYFENINLTIMGNNDVRIGKRLDIVDGPLLMGLSDVTRSYYIETYMDSWNYPGSWTQTITGTRGVFIDKTNNQESFSYEKMTNQHLVTSASMVRKKE